MGGLEMESEWIDLEALIQASEELDPVSSGGG
jgi:hypothetical protein